MKASRSVTIAASLTLVVCLTCSMLLLHHLDQIRPAATLEEVLYLPSPKVLKRLSLGYEGLLADIYWTRAVQYFGGKHHEGSKQYRLLAPLLEITTALDPHLLVAYEFGANFLTERPPSGAGEPQRAVDLVQYGIRNNPDQWRLYYNLGFIYYLELKDYTKAADAFESGSKVPNAHAWMTLWAAEAAQKGRSTRMARTLWIATYENTQDKMIRANANAHLRALQVDEEVGALETLVAQYQLAKGSQPASFSDLIAANMLRKTPVDPLGSPYILTHDGRVEVRDPDQFPFIQLGKPLGYVPPDVPKILPTD